MNTYYIITNTGFKKNLHGENLFTCKKNITEILIKSTCNLNESVFCKLPQASSNELFCFGVHVEWCSS